MSDTLYDFVVLYLFFSRVLFVTFVISLCVMFYSFILFSSDVSGARVLQYRSKFSPNCVMPFLILAPSRYLLNATLNHCYATFFLILIVINFDHDASVLNCMEIISLHEFDISNIIIC